MASRSIPDRNPNTEGLTMKFIRPLAAATLLMSAAACFAQISANTVRVPDAARFDAPFADPAASPACARDVARLCANVEPGRHRVGECLYAAKWKITSSACKKEVVNAELAFDAAWPCRQDTKTLCASTTPGEGRMGQCLADNEHHLSRSCAAYRQSSWNAYQTQPGSTVKRLESMGAAPVWSEGLR